MRMPEDRPSDTIASMRSIACFVATAAMLMPLTALAHPGNTDAYGCHVCRTNCPAWGLRTGEYHCHTKKKLPQPKAPIHSTKKR
jgi:hypothetical protein